MSSRASRSAKRRLAYVVDSTGTLIAHPDISLVLKKSDLSALPQVAARCETAPPAGRSLLARNHNGEEVLSADAPIRALSWTVFVESPIAEAFAPLYATLQTTSLVLVVALLISMAASFFLARALVRPLRALQEGAAQIGQGDLDRHIEVRTGDELEGLAEQFNRMSAQLRESYAGLERKVEQRTASSPSALEHQTATAEVLRVISSSVADSVPVFEKILESCDHLFASNEQGILLLGDDGRVHLAAHHGHARERLRGHVPVVADRRIPDPAARARRPPLQGRSRRPRRPCQHPRHRRAARHRQLLAGVRADGLGGPDHRHLVRHAPAADRLLRQGDRAAAHLRRPGGDRDPERRACSTRRAKRCTRSSSARAS